MTINKTKVQKCFVSASEIKDGGDNCLVSPNGLRIRNQDHPCIESGDFVLLRDPATFIKLLRPECASTQKTWCDLALADKPIAVCTHCIPLSDMEKLQQLALYIYGRIQASFGESVSSERLFGAFMFKCRMQKHTDTVLNYYLPNPEFLDNHLQRCHPDVNTEANRNDSDDECSAPSQPSSQLLDTHASELPETSIFSDEFHIVKNVGEFLDVQCGQEQLFGTKGFSSIDGPAAICKLCYHVPQMAVPKFISAYLADSKMFKNSVLKESGIFMFATKPLTDNGWASPSRKLLSQHLHVVHPKASASNKKRQGKRPLPWNAGSSHDRKKPSVETRADIDDVTDCITNVHGHRISLRSHDMWSHFNVAIDPILHCRLVLGNHITHDDELKQDGDEFACAPYALCKKCVRWPPDADTAVELLDCVSNKKSKGARGILRFRHQDIQGPAWRARFSSLQGHLDSCMGLDQPSQIKGHKQEDHGNLPIIDDVSLRQPVILKSLGIEQTSWFLSVCPKGIGSGVQQKHLSKAALSKPFYSSVHSRDGVTIRHALGKVWKHFKSVLYPQRFLENFHLFQSSRAMWEGSDCPYAICLLCFKDIAEDQAAEALKDAIMQYMDGQRSLHPGIRRYATVKESGNSKIIRNYVSPRLSKLKDHLENVHGVV